MVPFMQPLTHKLPLQILAAILACLFLSTSGASSFSEKKVLVLQSNDTQIKAGELIPASTTVRLAPKEMLRVMMSSGEVAKIRGAYTGSIGSALRNDTDSSVKIEDLAKAVVGRGQSRSALGAYRSTGQESGAPRYKEAVVRIVVGENGAYCISPGQRLVLWRPAAADAPFKLALDAGKHKEQLNWPAGAAEVNVPDKVTGSKPRRIVLPAHTSMGPTRARLWFGEYGDTPGEQLKWYESRGCDVQFDSALTFYQTF